MHSLTITREIRAPVETVFETVANVESFSTAIPGIVRVEVLSGPPSGVGTRFRETRAFGGKEVTTELEVTEFAKNERVRLVSNSHGTRWDTVFTLRQKGDRTELRVVMEAHPQTFLARVGAPLALKAIAGVVNRDIDALQSYCEARA